MKNKVLKFTKKLVLNSISNNTLKSLIFENFNHVKYSWISCVEISKLLQQDYNRQPFINIFLSNFETSYFDIHIDEIKNNINESVSETDAIDIIIDCYIKFFSLDLKIIKEKDNLDIVYEYNKLQIDLFLIAKKLIMKHFPLKLNIIIETFNKFRKPIYGYIKID